MRIVTHQKALPDAHPVPGPRPELKLETDGRGQSPNRGGRAAQRVGAFGEDKAVTNTRTVTDGPTLYGFVSIYCVLKMGKFHLV